MTSKKAILISIKPRFVRDILIGKKTIEVRKTCPQCELPVDVYIYCTKHHHVGYMPKSYAGKVVAKFTLKKVEEIFYQEDETEDSKLFNQLTCLTNKELDSYLKGKKGYAWLIDDLCYLEPRRLNDFNNCQLLWSCVPFDCKNCIHAKPITKAPQSWCYIEAEE